MTEPADLCLISGRVFDGKHRTAHTAVAVQDGRIAAIGSDEQVLRLVGPMTRVVNAAGGAITPGFVDAHAHAAFAGVERLTCDLTSARTEQETFDLIAAEVAQSDASWVTGGGWSHELFPSPTRQMLDAISTDRPIALSDAGHHTLWVNSKALELAGLDRNTPQPHNGQIVLDAEGEPTGYLNETAAELVGRIIPPATEDEIYDGLQDAQQFLWSLGVTGWHEAILGVYNGKADCTGAYRRGIADGTLTSQLSGALWIAPGLTAPEVPALVKRFVGLRAENAAAGFATFTVKAMIDGVPHGETAALIDSYCSHDGTGELHFTEETIFELVRQFDAAGFALHLHIMGDRGIRVALDAVEAARLQNGPGERHHFAHLSMVQTEDALRFGPLGITANMQALWAAPDPYVVPMIGEERMRRGYPFRTIADGGADLAMGSDWPVSPPDPWLAIHVAVNRSLPGPPAGAGVAGADAAVLDATQSLTLTEALAAYTSGSSELVLRYHGRLRVGERANLAVSTFDPFEIDPSRLIEVATAATVVGGELVYVRDGAGGNGTAPRS